MLAIFRQLYKTLTHNFCAKDSVLTKWFDPFSMSVYARRCEVELMHCESIDWNEDFLTKKGQLNGGKPLVSILFLTLYMISVSFTRISKLFFRGKKIVLSIICFYIFSFFFYTVPFEKANIIKLESYLWTQYMFSFPDGCSLIPLTV